jgi:uncharacterized protein (TIGR03067 family)
MKKTLFMGVLCLLLAGVGLVGCPGGLESIRLQGEWEATETYGQTTTVTQRLVIDDDNFVLTSYFLVATGKKGTFNTDCFSDPKTIDFSIEQTTTGEGSLQIVQTVDPATTLYAIYDISGDTLKIQFGNSSDRPADFSDDDVVTFKRVD